MDLLVDVGRGSGRERNGPVAEVHVVIFELRRPCRSEGIFDARASRPADARVSHFDGARQRVAVGREVIIGPRDTALAVNEPAIERDAEAAGQGRDPVDVRVERVADRCSDDRSSARSALDAGPGEVAFRTEDELTDLVIEADLSTAE